MAELSITSSPAAALNPEDVAWLTSRLAAYNTEKSGGMDLELLHLFLRTPEGVLCGGLMGWTIWSWMHIDSLWVEAEYRGQDHGKRLLQTAEEIAVNRGCTLVEVDTFSFQARGFYEKSGYKIFGTLSGIGGRFDRYYLSKTIGALDVTKIH